MLKKKFIYVFFFLCFIKFRINKALRLAITYDELNDAILQSNIKSEVIRNNISNVYINNTFISQIYSQQHHSEFVNTEDDVGYFHDVNIIENLYPKRLFYRNTINKLYKSVNCEFAEWTRDELLKIVEPLPVLYHRDFQETNVNVFNKFCEKSTTLFTDLMSRVEVFVNILLNYQKVFSSVSDQSIDTDNLTSLLSLSYKMQFLQNLCDPTCTTLEKSENLIVRIILGAANLIQNYVYQNCALTSSHNDSKRVYGFLKNKNRKNIDRFIAYIKPLKLESTKTCNLEQILFTKIITPKFENVKWKTNHGQATVKDVVKKIRKSYELSFIIWYQRYMFDTVVKIFCIRTKEYFGSNGITSLLSEDEVADFITIVSTFRDNIVLPAELERIFSRSILKIEGNDAIEHDDFMDELTDYIDSLTSVSLGQFADPDRGDTADNKPGERFDSRSVSQFRVFIATLKVNLEDLTCFVRLFDFFRDRYRPLKLDFAGESQKIASFERDVSGDEESKNAIAQTPVSSRNEFAKIADDKSLIAEGCKFFGLLYHLLFTVTIDLNHVRSGDFANLFLKFENYNLVVASYAVKVLFTVGVVEKLLHSSTALYSYFRYFTTATKTLLSIAQNDTLFEMFDDVLYGQKHAEDVLRVTHLAMNELNDYGIEHCRRAGRDFLFFDDIDFAAIGKLGDVRDEAMRSAVSMETLLGNVSKRSAMETLDVHWAYGALLTSLVDPRECARIFWNGDKRSLKYVYEYVTLAAVSGSYSVEFYDVVIKCAFSAIHKRLYGFFSNVSRPEGSDERAVRSVAELVDVFFRDNEFPRRFDSVARTLRKYGDPDLTRERAESLKVEVDDALDAVGVSANMNFAYGSHNVFADFYNNLNLLMHEAKMLADLIETAYKEWDIAVS